VLADAFFFKVTINWEIFMLSRCRMLLLALVVLTSNSTMAQDGKQHAKRAVELGWTYFNTGDTDTALKRFNQALLIDPKFAPAYFGIAYVYSVQNKLDQAIQNYRKSIDADPTFSHSYSNLGLALVYSGKVSDALPMLIKALELDPKNGDAYVNTSIYYFTVGDFVSSWKYVHMAQDNMAVVRPELLRDLKEKMPEPPRQKAATSVNRASP
jgi:Tfp pilus assembly protein PilF